MRKRIAVVLFSVILLACLSVQVWAWNDFNQSRSNKFGGIVDSSLKEIEVEKRWDDGNYSGRPTEIRVQLLKDGLPYNDIPDNPVTLNAGNNWKYTWTGLAGTGFDSGQGWSVRELDIPAGYSSVTSSTRGSDKISFIIENRRGDKYVPRVRKVVEGTSVPSAAYQFQFKLAPDPATAAFPMPGGQSGGTKIISITVTGAGSGTADFGVIEYNTAGTYVYKITEEPGNPPHQNFTYDLLSVYTLTVVVGNVGGDFLITSSKLEKGGTTIANEVAEFTNNYTPPPSSPPSSPPGRTPTPSPTPSPSPSSSPSQTPTPSVTPTDPVDTLPSWGPPIEPPPPDISFPPIPITPTPSPGQGPRTGDNSSLWLWAALLVIGAPLLWWLVGGVMRKRKK